MVQETTTSHDWREAGEAWGDRATDWAYLWEPYARSANQAVFDQLAVADGTRLLDIACGSGFAAHLASERGAAVSGIDASEALVAIARARTPEGDLRVGDMFALPFPDASFDTATSFNGIWKGCGPSVPAIRAVGLDDFCDALRSVIEPMHIPGVGIRITSEFDWITACSR